MCVLVIKIELYNRPTIYKTIQESQQRAHNLCEWDHACNIVVLHVLLAYTSCNEMEHLGLGLHT